MRKGIKSSQLSIIMVLVSIILTVALSVVSFRLYRTYEELTSMIERQMTLQQSAQDLKDASDYLTDQVRQYVIHGKKEYSDNFFHEVEVDMSRDKALDTIRKYEMNTSEVESLIETALNYSNELLKTEEYAMRLVAEANHEDLSAYNQNIIDQRLSEKDKLLSDEEKKDRALEMVYDRNYANKKNLIYSNISKATEITIRLADAEKEAVSASYQKLLLIQNILTGLIMLAVILFLFIFSRLYVSPLLRFSRAIEEQKQMEGAGSEELQVLAGTYNHMLEQIRSSQVELSYEASHDPLTGLYNRKVFETSRAELENGALLLIDVDHFKGINDTYGHEIGDKVLIKLAGILKENFRSEDYVCRIGGDEFAVIMMHVNSSLKALVENKIRKMNEQMHDTSDGLPYNSLSIGVAFSDRPNPGEDIYVDCDKALYEAKEAGRNGYRFYQDI